MGGQNSLRKYIGQNGKVFDTPEEAYWETRYSQGLNSGAGSGGEERDWKWKAITKLVPEMTYALFQSVVDVACGDLRFWEGRIGPEEYVGIDISKTIVEENRRKQPNWDFIWSPAERRIEGLKAPVVLCMDLLFHIMDDDRFEAILENLCYYSSRYILIHTWIVNPLGNREPYTDGEYMTFRRFEDYFPLFEKNGFSNQTISNNPNGVGALYFFDLSPIL